MPYYNGSANDFTAVRAALFSACTANGWTLNVDILSKGAAFVQATVNAASTTAKGIGVIIQGGTGASAGALVNPSPNTPRLGPPQKLGVQPTFPVEYYIHVYTNPDEVYLVVKFNSTYHYWLAFGVSNVPGIPGTGLWLSGGSQGGEGPASGEGIIFSTSGGGNGQYSSGAIFWDSAQSVATPSQNQDTIHLNMDGTVWAGNPASTSLSIQRAFDGLQAATVLLGNQPNTWNSEAVLVRIKGYYWYASTKAAIVCDLLNARYIRVDNYTSGDIIQLGSDKWKVYPFYRKNTASRNGASSVDHTGTFGWAIRYDGI